MGGGELLVEEQGVEEAEAVRLGHHLHRAGANPLLCIASLPVPSLSLSLSPAPPAAQMEDSPKAPPLKRSQLRNNQLPKFNSPPSSSPSSI